MSLSLYADHHATTPLCPEALEAMLPWLRDLSGNPSSIHAAGRASRKAVEDAREEVGRAINALPEEIVFTSGGTESDNLAVRGASRAAWEVDRLRARVAITEAEHAAVREAARALLRDGLEVVEIPVDGDGLPTPRGLESALTSTTALVSAILAGNETGAVNSGLSELVRAAHGKAVLVHTDAVQAVGKITVDVKELGVDLLSLTAHKFGGPKGAGALYVKTGTRILPLTSGGGQEKGRRAGTENVPAIVGLGAALRVATSRREREAERLTALRDRLEEGLGAAWPGVRFNATASKGTRRLHTVSSAVFPGVDAETLLVALDLEGIAASSGSACAAGTTTPSRVLLATGLSPSEVRSTLRFSFGWTTTGADIERLLEALPRLLARVRSAGVASSPRPA